MLKLVKGIRMQVLNLCTLPAALPAGLIEKNLFLDM